MVLLSIQIYPFSKRKHEKESAKSKGGRFFLFQAVTGYVSFNHGACYKNRAQVPTASSIECLECLYGCDICERYWNKAVAICCDKALYLISIHLSRYEEKNIAPLCVFFGIREIKRPGSNYAISQPKIVPNSVSRCNWVDFYMTWVQIQGNLPPSPSLEVNSTHFIHILVDRWCGRRLFVQGNNRDEIFLLGSSGVFYCTSKCHALLVDVSLIFLSIFTSDRLPNLKQQLQGKASTTIYT